MKKIRERSGSQSSESERNRLNYTSKRKGSIFVTLFLISLILPFSVFLGPVRLSPYKILLLVIFFPALFRLFAGAAGKIRATDVLMILFALWGALALVVNTATGAAVEPAGNFILEILGPYLLARTYIRDEQVFLAFSRCAYTILILLIPFAVYESLTGTPIILEMFRKFAPVFPNDETKPRLGLSRAQVVFEHPIAFGAFVSSQLGLSIYVFRNFRGFFLSKVAPGFVVFASVLSLSTGALAAMTTQLAFTGWEYITRGVRSRWTFLGVGFALLYLAIDLLSNRTPFHVLVSYLTFSSHSSYNRILIFQYGIAEVGRHPIFGIGLGDWTRPDWMSPSMDNFWLINAVRYGLPAFIFLVLSIFFMMKKIGSMSFKNDEINLMRLGLFVSLAGVFVGGGTVHYFNAMGCWTFFLIGSAMWMMDSEQNSTYDAEESDASDRRRNAGRVKSARNGRSVNGRRRQGAVSLRRHSSHQ